LPFENVNQNLFKFTNDYLYHLNLDKTSNDFKEMFGDVKFICMGGTPKRMLQFALYMKNVIDYKLPTGHLFENITASTDRYTMYKVGPVLSVNVS
jgi:uridine phosphorylase